LEQGWFEARTDSLAQSYRRFEFLAGLPTGATGDRSIPFGCMTTSISRKALDPK